MTLGAAAPAGGDTATGKGFIERHWRRPIPRQGAAPARFSAAEKSLASASCGTCHPAQLADWTSSFHARAMGPGVAGQLVGMWREDPESARLCLSCHAPLAEQQPYTERGAPNTAFDAGLQNEGLTCAVCHVRRHERFGPPRRDGSIAAAPRERLPHNGVTRTTAFRQSTFCASCHQFAADDFALNGKLLENTHEEWKGSPAARAPMAGSEHEYVIARDVTLDLSREVFDTRIPPGGRASFAYRRRLDGRGLALRVTVTVAPDHFYERFFKSLLASGAGAGAKQIHEALETARRSTFEIFKKDLPTDRAREIPGSAVSGTISPPALGRGRQ